MLIHGNNLQELPKLPDNSVDAIITDPPYELGFMGKTWDSTGIAYNVELWQQCLRVLKPGGHLLAFSGSRTYHRMAVAIEDAGFQIRDQIMWVYGSGFPKSLDVSKAIDKQAGALSHEGKGFTVADRTDKNLPNPKVKGYIPPAPATAEAKQWNGWGTALKPAHEPIVLARKPLNGTVANNVLQHGTGALNIEASRIPSDDGFEKAWDRPIRTNIGAQGNTFISNGTQHEVDISANRPSGRWPANFIHDGSDEVLELFPEAGGGKATRGASSRIYGGGKGFTQATGEMVGYDDSGSAARFFYCAKANKRDRNEGLDDFQPKRDADRIADDGVGGANPRNHSNTAKVNHHPTVKPTELMRYLCRLITPPGGTILDPFTGSGSTGKAAILEGFNFIGIELDPEYITIAQARIDHAYTQRH
jgi:DNA modification methylase